VVRFVQHQKDRCHKKDKKQFDEMWEIPRLYLTACSNSVQLVPLHPILISILFYHYKQLTECMAQAEQIEARVEKEQDVDDAAHSGTLDTYLDGRVAAAQSIHF
jgi:hypothetical protein